MLRDTPGKCKSRVDFQHLHPGGYLNPLLTNSTLCFPFFRFGEEGHGQKHLLDTLNGPFTNLSSTTTAWFPWTWSGRRIVQSKLNRGTGKFKPNQKLHNHQRQFVWKISNWRALSTNQRHNGTRRYFCFTRHHKRHGRAPRSAPGKSTRSGISAIENEGNAKEENNLVIQPFSYVLTNQRREAGGASSD